MGKRRSEMKLIENEKARMNVFGKRKNNLLKKAKELSILCDVKVLVIISQLGNLKPEIWPGNDEELVEEIINRFKQHRLKDSFLGSKKTEFGGQFSLSEYKNMINGLSENKLQTLCRELDAKMFAVDTAIKSKQVMSESPKGLGLLNLGRKEKEEVIYQDQQQADQEENFIQMLSSSNQNYMEINPMMMMMPQNYGISYPEINDGSSNINIDQLPIQYVVDPSSMQPAAYTDPVSWMSHYYDPSIYYIPPGSYYPMMQGFPSQMNNLSG